MTFSDDFTIGSMKDLIKVIDELGFVPFLRMRLKVFLLRSILDPVAGITMEITECAMHKSSDDERAKLVCPDCGGNPKEPGFCNMLNWD